MLSRLLLQANLAASFFLSYSIRLLFLYSVHFPDFRPVVYGCLLQIVQLILILLSFHATSFLHALLSYSLSIRYSNHEFCLPTHHPPAAT